MNKEKARREVENFLQAMNKQLDGLDKVITAHNNVEFRYVSLAYINLKNVLEQFVEDLKKALKEIK